MNIDPTIIVALISLTGIIVSAIVTKNNLYHELDKKDAVFQEKLEQIDEHFREVNHKLEVHNGYSEKFASMTSDIKLMQQDIKYIKEKES